MTGRYDRCPDPGICHSPFDRQKSRKKVSAWTTRLARSEIMNVIDSKGLGRDWREKPLTLFCIPL
jgi:hypothetical protein